MHRSVEDQDEHVFNTPLKDQKPENALPDEEPRQDKNVPDEDIDMLFGSGSAEKMRASPQKASNMPQLQAPS